MVNGAVDGCGAVAIKERQQFVELRLRLWWHRDGVTIHELRGQKGSLGMSVLLSNHN